MGKRYLELVMDAYENDAPKNGSLAEHRKLCEAKPGNCPFEKRLDDADSLGSERPKRQGGEITPEQDAAYADAVKRGNTETALRMVREAAAKSMPDTKVVDEDGLPLVVYRGTPVKNPGYVFQYGKNYYGGNRGFWFASSKERAEGYSRDEVTGEVGDFKSVYLDASRLLDLRPLKYRTDYKRAFEYLSSMYDRHVKRFRGDLTVCDLYKKNQDDLYRGRENGIALCDEQSWSFIVKLPTQIKSADITYGDDKRLIPLSKRFDFSNPDIRY